MSHTIEIQVVVDESLTGHIEEGLKRTESAAIPEAVIMRLVTGILNDSDLPIAARKTGDRQIQLSYHMHSFSQPIF